MKGRNVFTSFLSLMAAVLLLLPLRASASFSFVQATNGGTGYGSMATTASSFTMHWSTTAGNSLFACIFFFGAAGKGVTVTPPSGVGWTLITRVSLSGGGIVAAYYIQNAAAQSGTYTWTFSGNAWAGGVFEEFSGGATSGLLGNYITSTGLPTNSLSDSSSSDLLICFCGGFNTGQDDIFSNPTNNFILATNAQGSDGNPVVQQGASGFMTYRILTSTGGPYSTSITSSGPFSSGWVLASFHAG